jgi:hypothetical protein
MGYGQWATTSCKEADINNGQSKEQAKGEREQRGSNNSQELRQKKGPTMGLDFHTLLQIYWLMTSRRAAAAAPARASGHRGGGGGSGARLCTPGDVGAPVMSYCYFSWLFQLGGAEA